MSKLTNPKSVVSKSVVEIKKNHLVILNLGICNKCALHGGRGRIIRDASFEEDGVSVCEWYCEECNAYMDQLADEAGLIHTHCFACSGFGETDGTPCANCEERGCLLAVSATPFREAKPL